jgi:hypothetical protein
MSSTTKPCGKISRRIGGNQLDLDQALRVGHDDEVLEQYSVAAAHEPAVDPVDGSSTGT